MEWDQLARRQGGMVRRNQLLAIGLRADRVDRLVASRQLLTTEFVGLYRAAGAPHTGDAQTWTVVLGTRAVLSYLSAAVWWDLPVAGDGRVHVSRLDRRRTRPAPGVRVHRTALRREDIAIRHGLVVTTRPETLLDCLGWLTSNCARTLLDRALQQSWIDRAAIQRRLDDQPGRWGNRQLQHLLAESEPGAEAESERRVHRILRAAGIGGWCGNRTVVLDGMRFRLDIAFLAAKVAVEVEGWAFHRSKERRDRDLVKANALARNGWVLITFSFEHTEDPEYICRSIRTVLAQRPSVEGSLRQNRHRSGPVTSPRTRPGASR